MFGTFIVDSFTKNEAQDIADALDEICSPGDSVGWASTGIYSFWDYYTKEIYYIGYAVDLANRFRQHNGILPINDGACKYQQIIDYFSKNQRLGYSIFVQSPLAQAATHRNHTILDFDDNTEWISQESKESSRIVEGSFIEIFRKRDGELPHWNKIGGSIIGSKRANLKMYDQLHRCLTGNQRDPLVARSTIREIAKNNVFEWYETTLHGVRMGMVSRQISFDEAVAEQIAINPFFRKAYDYIVAQHYLEKRPQI